jgi:hypothetical protein
MEFPVNQLANYVWSVDFVTPGLLGDLARG